MSEARPDSIEALIAGDAPLASLLEQARERTADVPGHDLAHALRVAHWTVRLGGGEGVDPREAVAAGLLHDLVDVPKDSPGRARASELSARAAEPLLRAAGFDEGATARICGAILTHSFSRGEKPRSKLGAALQDADRLEALGAIGVFRTVATGVRMGASFFDAADPWAGARPLDDKTFTVDHFFTKLLRLPATFTTDAGRREARQRADFLLATLRQLAHELGAPLPDYGPEGSGSGGESVPGSSR